MKKCPTKLLMSHPIDRNISADKLIFSSAQALGVGLEVAITAPTSPLQIDYIKRGLSLNRLTEFFLGIREVSTECASGVRQPLGSENRYV